MTAAVAGRPCSRFFAGRQPLPAGGDRLAPLPRRRAPPARTGVSDHRDRARAARRRAARRLDRRRQRGVPRGQPARLRRSRRSARRGPGRDRHALGRRRRLRDASRCAGPTPTRCASTSTAFRSPSLRAGRSISRRCRSATSSASRSTAAPRRSGSPSRRWAASCRSPRARRRAARASRCAPAPDRSARGSATPPASGSTGRLHVYAGAARDRRRRLRLPQRQGDGRQPVRRRRRLPPEQSPGAGRRRLARGDRSAGPPPAGAGRDRVRARSRAAGRGDRRRRRARTSTPRAASPTRSYDSRDDLGAGGRLHAQLFASAQRDRFIDPNGEIGAIPARTDDTTLSTGATVERVAPVRRMGARRRDGRSAPRDISAGQPAGRDAGRRAGRAPGRRRRRGDRLLVAAHRSRHRAQRARRGRARRRHRARRALPAPASGVGADRPRAAGRASRPGAAAVGRTSTLKANAGRYGRAPSFLELYGDTGPLLGNPLLRPEIGWNGDLAAEYHARWRARVGRAAAPASSPRASTI